MEFQLASGPLEGIKVLDMTAYIAGPFACSLLADLGADVIKVEPPEGDMMRYYPSSIATESRTFLGVNRGKQGIVVDLKTKAGTDALVRIVSSMDVVVENMRPGVMTRLGIDYDVLKRSNPRLVYLSLTGYGGAGPMCDSAGYDQVLQSMTGIAVFQGAARDGGPQLIQGSIVDFYASSMAALGIVAALYRRASGEIGQRIGVSLLSAALSMQAGRFVRVDNEPYDIDRDLHGGLVAGIHPTKEGHIYLQASTPRFWMSLCTRIGLPDLATDSRYDSVRKRAALGAELLPKLHTALKVKTAVEWEAILIGHVPCAVVRSINEMFDDPQVIAQGLVERMEHASVGGYQGLARPIVFESTPLGPVHAAPGLGEHTDNILASAGFSATEISELRRSGAVK